MRAGDVIAERFELEAPAGAGGMGVVFRARDRATNGRVALKVLHGAGDPARFAREALVLAQLAHPGVVRYVAHGATAHGAAFLAMEWLEGEDLAARLRRAPLALPESLALGARVADALAAVHAAGVVHRDIKPSNLFLAGAELARVQLIDFGLAFDDATRAVPPATVLTASGMLVGTPGYMAPEQARGERDVDARADVFALGCVLFECVVGRAPFTGADRLAVLMKTVLEPAAPLARVAPAAPAALGALLAEMLAKDPAERPRDGGVVASRLRAIAAASAISVGGATPAPWPGGAGAASPSGASTAPASLTARERRVSCVLVARNAENASLRPDGATLTNPGEGAADGAAGRDAIAGHGGELEVLADGSFLVTVGGDGPMTDQAARAARCALGLRAAIRGMAIALVARRGAADAGDGIGAAVDRSVALLRDTTAGAIRVDEALAGLLDMRFDVRGGRDASHGAGAASDDGARGGGGLYLHGERDASEGTRTLLGRATPCVGRERELATARALYDECCAEPVAQALVIVGPAGIGKSRLRYELLRAIDAAAASEPASVSPLRGEGGGGFDAAAVAFGAAAPPPAVWLGRGDPMRVGSPFGLVGQALRRTAGILDGEPLAARRSKLRARVGRRLSGADALRVAQFLGEVVGVRFSDADAPALRAARRDAMLMADQVRAAFEELLAAECDAGPLVLVLEDLHWGDLPSVHLVDAALRALADRPLLVLATARPEVSAVFPRLWSERRTHVVHLGELTRRGSEALVRAALGDGVPADLVARITTLAAGNAFYLEELIRAVAERRGAAPQDGGGGGGGADAVALPETVLAMAQARLDALEPEARRVLRAGAVFGQVFWRGGALALLGGAEVATDVPRWLDHLVAREVLTRRATAKFPGETEYVFRHALLREAAYAMLTPEDQALGHRLAGEWLAAAGESDAVVVASHLERGGAAARAVEFYRRAAEQALEGDDPVEAIARAERGLACGADGEERGGLLLVQARAHKWRGENAAKERIASKAMFWLGRGTAAWYGAIAEAGGAAINLGRVERVEQLAAIVADPAVDPAAEPARLMAAVHTVTGLVQVGRHAAARALWARIEPDAAASTDVQVAGRVHEMRSFWALAEGDLSTAVTELHAFAECFAAVGDRRQACIARINAGYMYGSLGQYDAAEAVLRDALAAAERIGLRRHAAAARHNLGMVLALRGALEEALAHERAAIEAFAAQGEARMLVGSRVYLAKILERAGDRAGAVAAARAAASEGPATHPLRVVALATLAQIEARAGAPADAAATAREAAAAFASIGKVEDGATLVNLAFAEAHAAAGELDAARAAIVAARDDVLARAARITDPALRASFLERVPEHARVLELARALRA